MKGFFAILLFGVTSAYIELWDAYGPVNETKSPFPPWLRSVKKNDCSNPLEIVIVQDVSDSFQQHIDTMRDVQVAEMTRVLQGSHPGTKFSVVSFRDKPLWPHGTNGDFCQRFETSLSSEASKVKEVFSRLQSAGGADPAENQFGAIVAAAQSETPGWSKDSETLKLMVLATDACPHFADDGMNVNGLDAFSGHFDEESQERQCLSEYYPSPKQVKDALTKRNAYLAQLIFDDSKNNGSVQRCWNWFNEYLGQDSIFLEPLAKDGSNFWSVLSKVIAGVGCETAPTSTNTVAIQFQAEHKI